MANLGRPPVITVLGHVDHGKTSLLDKIRKANVAAREQGGITQAIGAYQIELLGQKLTFIDTPGHAAFSAMRARGGKVADLAILVIAADDGVMPQTRESIEHIKAAGIPYIVAINKVDLPQANVTKVKSDLAEAGEYVEGYGGNIPVVEISAKTGAGIEKLLETVILLAELEELTDTSNEPTSAVVIESQLHPHKGPLASLLVKTGHLSSKDDLYVGTRKFGKVRSLIGASSDQLSVASPGTPVLVLGFQFVPAVGDLITTIPGQAVVKAEVLGKTTTISETKQVNIILKADVAGSLEAILGSLPDGVNVLNSAVGGVTESDVALAASNSAIIVCFNVKVAGTVAKLAAVEKVEVISFGIIYELFDYLKDLVEKVQKADRIEVVGEAKILKTFPFDNTTVYGCLVTSGKIRLGDKVAQTSKIVSIRIGKETVKEAKKDSECGIILTPPLDYKIGDVIIAHI
jgi:translation initiation factor IF-2